MVVVAIVKAFCKGGIRMSAREIVASEAARRLGWRLNYLYSELSVGRFPGARKDGDIWVIPASGVARLIQRRRKKSRGDKKICRC